jgi:hypothetical protein
MFQRISGYIRGMIALGPLPLRPVLGIVLSCVAAEAGMENAVFALDYKPKFVASKAIPYLCDNPATAPQEPNYSPNYTNTSCLEYTLDRCPMGPGQVYVVIARAGSEGIAGASFGISYSGSMGVGIDPQYVTWTPCADGLSFPNNDGVHGDFPQPGGGLRVTWNTSNGCPAVTQQVIGGYGAHAVVGSFYIYALSDDVLRLTPNNNLQGGVPEVAIANCTGETTDLIAHWGPFYGNYLMGRIGFGNQAGWQPCEFFPVAATTWGKVKSMYKKSQ